ncbi:MAG: DUF4065 domain-containing protein [Ignavibacteriaceae bacterium]|nr:DUF4065 domain-containing protein [Ignavibacteriaceae bacterium]HRN25139.1 DUF4065 domain-containing protein [Ignavibacteriaceae bacterium]HRP93639.1 DUF4065 domain-containing protein [Ignavibacteriaceae bacterium]HRQ54117.1 DUF4065 domain-containing protein [Ignavibacteriaceae bacterium]
MDIKALAQNIILSYEEIFEESLTHLKLQKLLFYTYVWSLVDNKALVNNTFKKWKYGPVNPEIYQEYKKYGDNFIPLENLAYTKVAKQQKKLMDFVIANYGKFSPITLSAMTHQDEPWQNTAVSETISDDVVKIFYSKLNFAKNFPVDFKKPFYPVETDLHYSFVLDFSETTKSNPFAYKSYYEYLKLHTKSKKDLIKLLDECSIN